MTSRDGEGRARPTPVRTPSALSSAQPAQLGRVGGPAGHLADPVLLVAVVLEGDIERDAYALLGLVRSYSCSNLAMDGPS
jgi:hypothetical protein